MLSTRIPPAGADVASVGVAVREPVRQLPLRPYQREALDAVTAAYCRGQHRLLVAHPTGTGKTVLFSSLIAQRPGRALVLVHRDELVQQTLEKLRLVAPDLRLGVVKAERDEVGADVVIASVQTLAQAQRLARLVPNFATVVVDEAHHATADTYQRILNHVGAFAADGPLTLGVTATPERADGQDLGDVWEEIVHRLDLLTAIRAGYLCDLRAIEVRLAADFGAFHTRAGDFVTSEVDAALRDANAPEHVVSAWLEHAAGRSTVAFTPSVDSAHALAAEFRDAGVTTEALDGETSADERRAILGRLRAGATAVVVNCAVLTEGFDEPRVACVIVARPTRSRPLYVQMVGRGTRLYPGKDDCLVLDLAGTTRRHDLMTVADLFGVSPAALTERTVTELLAERERQAKEQDAPAVAGGRLVSVPVDLFKRRAFHWVPAGNGRFVLPCGTSLLILEPADTGTWRIVDKPSGQSGCVLAAGLSLAYAQGRAEDIARARGAGALVQRDASWRQAPATDKQLAALRHLRVPVRPTITKGEASDLIAARAAGQVAMR